MSHSYRSPQGVFACFKGPHGANDVSQIHHSHLREEGLVTFQKGRVTFDDLEGLTRLAGFDPDYLDQEGPLLR